MNSMNLPGFAAEASVYPSHGHYRVVGTGGAMASNHQRVMPQLPPTGFCMANCDAESDPLSRQACMFNCFEGSDGGGTRGPSGHCAPVCGPCVDGSKTCIRRDCSDYEVACRVRRPASRLA
jgi:hypothetical protein